MPAWRVATPAASAATATSWNACERHISVPRSLRSTIAPAGSDSTSHGTNMAADTSEMSRGSLVTVTAYSGSAVTSAPSPT